MSTLAYLCVPVCEDCADRAQRARSPGRCSDERCVIGKRGAAAAVDVLLPLSGVRLRSVPSARPRKEVAGILVPDAGNLRPSQLCAGFSRSRSELAKATAS